MSYQSYNKTKLMDNHDVIRVNNNLNLSQFLTCERERENIKLT